MGKIFLKVYLIVFLLLISSGWAGDLYQSEFLELELGVKGELELTKEGEGARAEKVRVELFLYPEENFQQKILAWESEGQVEGKKVVFEWAEPGLGRKEYGFEIRIRTENKRLGVNKKVAFPLVSTEGYEEYLKGTETIDKDYPKIIEKASELAEEEDDLFKVAFKLARWVGENVEYNLNTLTTEASQKASWVLEHRQGVCDEMTSLFIAMARSLGIPARFVSGVSYTTSELFKENWLPHGWAEVYFPGQGWVSFDIAFGEYGYVDVSHIKLREGFDPQEPSTKFEWIGNKVGLKAGELAFQAEVKEEGKRGEEEIVLEEEIIGKKVGWGSYNLVKAGVENKKDYYLATTLRLAVPEEVEVRGEKKKVILLEPKEKKEVFWLVKVSEDLKKGYWYEFPVMVYSEKNVSAEGKFVAAEGEIFYSQAELAELMEEEEEKRYQGKVGFECDYEKEIKVGEVKEIKCGVKNKGNLNLEGVEFCLGGVCKMAELRINQEEKLEIKVEGKEAGWQKILVKAENEKVKEKILLEYVVWDEPKVSWEIERPAQVGYGEDFEILLKMKKGSFALPKNLSLVLQGLGFENKWEMAELKNGQEFPVELNSRGLGRVNEYVAKVGWEDEGGKRFEEEKRITVEVEGKSWGEKIKIWLNSLIIFLRG